MGAAAPPFTPGLQGGVGMVATDLNGDGREGVRLKVGGVNSRGRAMLVGAEHTQMSDLVCMISPAWKQQPAQQRQKDPDARWTK